MSKSPDHLGKIAKQKWDELTLLLDKVDPREADVLALLCGSWATYLEAGALISKNGLITEGVGNHSGRTFANPAVGIQRESWKEIVRLSKNFGLIPARAPADDFFDDILKPAGLD